jgi:hypothetical protein
MNRSRSLLVWPVLTRSPMAGFEVITEGRAAGPRAVAVGAQARRARLQRQGAIRRRRRGRGLSAGRADDGGRHRSRQSARARRPGRRVGAASTAPRPRRTQPRPTRSSLRGRASSTGPTGPSSSGGSGPRPASTPRHGRSRNERLSASIHVKVGWTKPSLKALVPLPFLPPSAPPDSCGHFPA